MVVPPPKENRRVDSSIHTNNDEIWSLEAKEKVGYLFNNDIFFLKEDEIDQINPFMKEFLGKYAPDWIKDYPTEFMLLMTMTTITLTKFTLASKGLGNKVRNIDKKEAEKVGDERSTDRSNKTDIKEE